MMLRNEWTKSSFSADKPQCCVEARVVRDGVEVRDSKLGESSPVLWFTPDEWDAFTGGVRAGQFDREDVLV